MKHSIFFSVLVLLAFSCEKVAEDNAVIDQITDAAIEFRGIGGDMYLPGVDGYILIETTGYIGVCPKHTASFSAAFNGKTEDAGITTVDGLTLDKIVEDGEIRYLKRLSAPVDDVDKYSESAAVSCSFQTQMPSKYGSFARGFSFPTELCVETSIGFGGVLSKGEDLTITWNPSPVTDNLYVSLCTPGQPCIIKEFRDTGNAVIASSEFSNFVEGQSAYLYIGRGIGTVVQQTNRSKIGVLRVQRVNYPGLVIGS